MTTTKDELHTVPVDNKDDKRVESELCPLVYFLDTLLVQ